MSVELITACILTAFQSVPSLQTYNLPSPNLPSPNLPSPNLPSPQIPLSDVQIVEDMISKHKSIQESIVTKSSDLELCNGLGEDYKPLTGTLLY